MKCPVTVPRSCSWRDRKSVTLREDVEVAVPLARPPAAIAPEFVEGFFLVPRHGAMEDQ